MGLELFLSFIKVVQGWMKELFQWFPLVQIALLGYRTLYIKIGFSMAKVTLEFNTICNKVFYLVETKACMSIHDEF